MQEWEKNPKNQQPRNPQNQTQTQPFHPHHIYKNQETFSSNR